MKKILIIAGIAILAFLGIKGCDDDYDPEDEDIVEESNIDAIRDRVTAVEGNVLILESGLRVRVIGVDPNNAWAETYLKSHTIGKEVSLVADRVIQKNMSDADTEIPAYVILDSYMPSVNHQLLVANPRAFDPSEVSDSLEVFRPDEDKIVEIEDLALYMKMRSFLIETPSGHGTGFFINDEGLALTNNHVLSDDNAVACLYNDKAHDDSGLYKDRMREVGDILYTDEVLDITIFQVNLDKGEKVDYFNLAKNHVPQGTRVSTYGNPYNLTGTYTSGDLSAYRDIQSRPLVQYSMATNPGNSGGPVVTPTGLVIAVHDLGDKEKQNVNYGIDILAVRKVLDQKQLKYGGM